MPRCRPRWSSVPNAAKPLVARHSALRLRHELRRALRRGEDLARQGSRTSPAPESARARAACCQRNNRRTARYFYELASGRFGWSLDKVRDVQAFHFKFGQGAKTGTGGHLPGKKVQGRIAEVRELDEGDDAISPATFPDLFTPGRLRRRRQQRCARPREGFRSAPNSPPNTSRPTSTPRSRSASTTSSSTVSGGGTGAAPLIFRDHISVPTIPGARPCPTPSRPLRCVDGVTLVITGGLRTHTDFAKALALGADAVAVSNAAMQAIGCIGMRACHTDNCPVGIATQKKDLRARLMIDEAAERLQRYFEVHRRADGSAGTSLCGHDFAERLHRGRPHHLRSKHGRPRGNPIRRSCSLRSLSARRAGRTTAAASGAAAEHREPSGSDCESWSE